VRSPFRDAVDASLAAGEDQDAITRRLTAMINQNLDATLAATAPAGDG
jgi:hypothetical protein